MSNNKTQTEQSGLDKAIDTVFSEMAGVTCDSDEYSKMVDQLAKLYEIKKSYEKDQTDRVSLEKLLPVLGNLAGIAMILGFERAHVVTSKALGFVMKSRV